MYSRRDQVQAHSFLVGRLVSAVLRVDPDALDRPLRRSVVGLFGGTAVAGLVLVVLLVIGLLSPGGGDAWREPGALIVAEDTGSRYVMVEGRLRPVLNYASARLLLGAAPKVATVDSADLAGMPQGGPVGIMGAPDTLPAAGGAPRAWTVCSMSTPDGPAVALALTADGRQVPVADGALLVRTPNGSTYLVWRERRMRIAENWVPTALGLNPSTAVRVTESWLNALPAGPDLGSPKVQRGGDGPVIAGRPTTIGLLIQVPEAVVGDRFYLVQPGGLLPVSATVAALLVADPAAVEPPRQVTGSALAASTMLPALDWQGALPPEPPTQLELGDGAPCVRWAGDKAEVVVGPKVGGNPDPAVQGAVRDNRTADRVLVAPGAGLLVRTRPAPGVPGAGLYLVTDAGTKFPVASGDAAAALGQPADSAAQVPADLIALLPTGPVLDKIA
ncbi:type VII secretion protein EccB [Actinokineospora globicatena]|uniref:type VII secretion protein EccB n=1 Tax=Actinokineospora globicatena TaxID=103729 RepID=UPI0020A44BEC|nr:type VII secretion protein EccB [Actinokineospora globicatena]MCP2306602.1 type VII secretion protein EccB [Actinokineospora globicatena]GLW82036.1 type VII secretion protein EccB [Actinokineospora globicatena]GLW88830.1 type VII secretion protein EccB [Actinokineospora globicatena]